MLLFYFHYFVQIFFIIFYDINAKSYTIIFYYQISIIFVYSIFFNQFIILLLWLIYLVNKIIFVKNENYSFFYTLFKVKYFLYCEVIIMKNLLFYGRELI